MHHTYCIQKTGSWFCARTVLQNFYIGDRFCIFRSSVKMWQAKYLKWGDRDLLCQVAMDAEAAVVDACYLQITWKCLRTVEFFIASLHFWDASLVSNDLNLVCHYSSWFLWLHEWIGVLIKAWEIQLVILVLIRYDLGHRVELGNLFNILFQEKIGNTEITV